MSTIMRFCGRTARTALAVLALVAGAAAAFAGTGDGGSNAADFLRLGNGGAAAAQGEAYAARSGVIDALHYNPGALTRIGKAQIQLQHNEYLLDIKSDYLAGAFSAGRWTFGASALMLDEGEFTRRTYASPGGTGSFDAGASKFTFGAARQITDDLTLGAAVDFFREEIDNASRGGVAFDLGAHIKTLDDFLELGFALRNLGPGVKFDRDVEGLPMEFALGVHVPRLLVDGLKISSELTFVRRQEPEFKTGVEYGVMSLVFLRAGYDSRNDLGSGLTAGLGLRLGIWDMDYAYVPFDDAGSSHRVSMTFAFGRPSALGKPRKTAARSGPPVSKPAAADPAPIVAAPAPKKPATLPAPAAPAPKPVHQPSAEIDLADEELPVDISAPAVSSVEPTAVDTRAAVEEMLAKAQTEILRREREAQAAEFAGMARGMLNKGEYAKAAFYASQAQGLGSPDAAILLKQIDGAATQARREALAREESQARVEFERREAQAREEQARIDAAEAAAAMARREEDVQLMRFMSLAWDELADENIEASKVHAYKALALGHEEAMALLTQIDNSQGRDLPLNRGMVGESMRYLARGWDMLAKGDAAQAQFYANKALAMGNDGAIPLIRRAVFGR